MRTPKGIKLKVIAPRVNSSFHFTNTNIYIFFSSNPSEEPHLESRTLVHILCHTLTFRGLVTLSAPPGFFASVFPKDK